MKETAPQFLATKPDFSSPELSTDYADYTDHRLRIGNTISKSIKNRCNLRNLWMSLALVARSVGKAIIEYKSPNLNRPFTALGRRNQERSHKIALSVDAGFHVSDCIAT